MTPLKWNIGTMYAICRQRVPETAIISGKLHKSCTHVPDNGDRSYKLVGTFNMGISKRAYAYAQELSSS